jgi:hypothetical protein
MIFHLKLFVALNYVWSSYNLKLIFQTTSNCETTKTEGVILDGT